MSVSTLSFQRPGHRVWVGLCRLALLVAVSVLPYYSLMPSSAIGFSFYDKLLHFVAYGLLAGIIAAAFPKLRLFWVFVITSMLGGVLEIAQELASTGRTASWFDQLANMGGAALAIMLWCALAWGLNRLGSGCSASDAPH